MTKLMLTLNNPHQTLTNRRDAHKDILSTIRSVNTLTANMLTTEICV